MSAQDRIEEYVLGRLDEAERRAFEAELERTPALAAEVAELEFLMTELALDLTPLAPSAAVRTRLLEQVEGAERYAPLFEKICAFAALTVDRVRAIMAEAREAARWSPGPLPGVMLFHFEGGPALAGADVGLVQMPAGFVFPEHEHLGQEVVLVLEGGYTDLTTGQHYGPGDLQASEPGTAHAFRVDEGPELCFAIMLTAEVRILGMPG